MNALINEFQKELTIIESKNNKILKTTEEGKREFVRLNQTLAINELKTKRLRSNNLAVEEIQKHKFKIEKNNLELRILESEVSDLKIKRMIFKYKLKEIYLDLIKKPEKLM